MNDDCCYLCNECPSSYASLDDLEKHMAGKHASRLREDPNKCLDTTAQFSPLGEASNGVILDATSCLSAAEQKCDFIEQVNFG